MTGTVTKNPAMNRTLTQFRKPDDMVFSIMPSDAHRAGRKPVALVTGGAVRLGRAIALALAERGMDVAITWHRSGDDARRTVRALEARGARTKAFRADLRTATAARRVVEQTAAA